MNDALKAPSAFQQARPARIPQGANITGALSSSIYRIPTWRSVWVSQLKDRLNELVALPHGWDGYTGSPVSFQCASFVANMLERLYQEDVPTPSLVPGSDGSLQVEWHRNMFDVELDVLDAQNVVATRLNLQTHEEEVFEIQNDFSAIVPWISALSNGSQTAA